MPSPAHPSFINSLPRFRAARIVAAVGLLGAVATAQAVTIQVDSFTLTPGAGYGVDKGKKPENGGTLLDVSFFSSLDSAVSGDSLRGSSTFVVGRINFREPDSGDGNGNTGIRSSEDDDLDVTAAFALGAGGPPHELRGLGTVTLGLIDDGDTEAVDYRLTWQPLEVDLGDDGRLKIELLDLEFSTWGEQPLQARFTLLDPPPTRSVDPAPGAVPEPGTLAIFVLGLAGLGTLRRARRAG